MPEIKEMPLLKATDIEARVQQVLQGGSSALLLLYKSARTDMRILDEVYGALNWKRSHECIEGKMFCTISVWDSEKKEWVSKQDVGVPSNRDAQKGEASDSFKRAGFNWGIGRELYDAPTIFVNLYPDEVSGGRLKPSVGFIVTEAEYDRETHSFKRLVITDRKGRVRWSLNKSEMTVQTQKKEQPQAKNASLIATLDRLCNAKGIGVSEFCQAVFKGKKPDACTEEQLREAIDRFNDAYLRYQKMEAAMNEEIPMP